MILHEQGLDSIVVRKLGLDIDAADLSEWEAVEEELSELATVDQLEPFQRQR